MTRRILGLLPFLLVLSWSTAAHGAPPPSHAPSWPAPGDPLTLTRNAGLVPERHETLIHHVHSHLDVYVNAQHVQVPAGIGINVHDPAVQHLKEPSGMWYGGIVLCKHPCISPLHTHDTTGILHTESATAVPNRLGQFFVEWNVRLTAQCVSRYCEPATKIAVYVNGTRYRGDPRTIQLLNHREIAIVIGKPPKFIPPTAVFPSP